MATYRRLVEFQFVSVEVASPFWEMTPQPMKRTSYLQSGVKARIFFRLNREHFAGLKLVYHYMLGMVGIVCNAVAVHHDFHEREIFRR